MNLTPYKPLIEQLAGQTIGLIQREYPNGIRLSLFREPESLITPRGLYPAFYGCYDWHSAVHSHWQIVSAMRLFPEADFVPRGKAALGESLRPEHIATEMRWIEERNNFEMPYGMAWLLTLCAELKEWGTPEALSWHQALQPMEGHAVERFCDYCQKMLRPMRGGLHNQSAFSLSLGWDYAAKQPDPGLRDLISEAAQRFYGGDSRIDLNYEPSASDFLSPALSEADLMGRILSPGEFAHWLDQFAPDGFDRLQPVSVVDPSDGQLAHWAGLNLSRAWMLSQIGNALPAAHPLIEGLKRNAMTHRDVGLPMATHPDYIISHWVPTFALYLLSPR